DPEQAQRVDQIAAGIPDELDSREDHPAPRGDGEGRSHSPQEHLGELPEVRRRPGPNLVEGNVGVPNTDVLEVVEDFDVPRVERDVEDSWTIERVRLGQAE